MGVGDHQLDALQAAADEVAQESRPERLGFAGSDVQADDLALALGRHRDGDYGGDADDPAAFADLEAGGIEPEVRPVADKRPLQERAHPLVDVLAQLRHARLGDAVHPSAAIPSAPRTEPWAALPMAGTSSSTRRVLTPVIHASWITETSAFLAVFLEEAGEVGTGPELGDLQVERAEPGIERPVAVAVAPRAAITRALVAAGRRSGRRHRPP